MKWKVDLFEDYNTNKMAIRIYQEIAGRYSVLVPMMSDGKIGWGLVTVEDGEGGETFPMTIELGRHMVKHGVLDALLTALEDHGARSKKDAGEATVSAMANHLSDLQSLLFGSDSVKIDRRGAVEVQDAGV